MINLSANEELKRLCCEWDCYEWVPPDLVIGKFLEIQNKYYTDFVIVKVTINDPKVRYFPFSGRYALLVAGYIMAKDGGRDSGARIADGVEVLEGGFNSGDSVKNFIFEILEGTVIKMKVSRNVLKQMQRQVEEGQYTFEVIEENQQ